ncbi:M1 family metallopeptidase [Dyella caseinilytica]|uniref:M1 family metallopeptidase n=1 Tax=Dyella caseinilytica TaxID=1849581 RepID=A0ABX7GW81_9GAMM|nr:M1 family metallopeptidase [Dyella caseinilytica]QRN54313.1 M1 family metallopeptidase [Dyella caseinilytica]GFZ93211.1 peptidase [Dyella caseinilytica]
MKTIPTLCGAVLAALSLSASLVVAADAPPSGYNPFETFAPFVYPQPSNGYRSGSGKPGPLFWQNRADYQIKAALDPDTRKLTADEVITYTNHSPDDLDVLWLQVEQNRYLKDARGAFDDGKFPTEFTDGEHITSIAVEGTDGKLQKADWVISDTRMQIRLPQPLKARDGKLRVHISYSYTVPGEFGGRTDVNPTKNGDIFEIAQWYPRMCVYDDLRGWTTDPYLNNEFYLEYGDYDYSVTVPWNMIVVGAGELLNPQDVLTKTEMQRLDQARHSDTTVMIRSADEVNDPNTRPKQSGTLTWHFRIQNSRDAVFGASKAYIWDAARINLGNGKTALAESAYPVESAGKEAWGRATEYVKAATEYFSKQWYPYPYPVAINEAGSAGGMEYPSITFDSKEAKGSDLHALIAHEIGHTWFPMIVGTDERRNAWMDEGFNTFIDVYEADNFNHGEYAPKRDPEYAPGHGNPADEIVKVLTDPDAPPLLTRADEIQEKYRHPVTYFKSAYGLVLLREQIIGPERFDPAFRKYIQTWAYKHPSPSDFFRFMESETGEDLSWFWRGWYEYNWKLDLAIQNVTPIDGDWRKGAQVTVANLDKLVMPSTLEVVYTDGSKQDIRVPVETWMQHRSYVIRVDGNKPVKSATIDPQHAIPDVDRSNNTFTVR